MGRISVVLPYPLLQLSFRVEPAKTVANSGILQILIRCRTVASFVLIHKVRSGETAFDGNGTVAVCFYQALEKPVAKYKKIFAAMKCFSKAKQLHRVIK